MSDRYPDDPPTPFTKIDEPLGRLRYLLSIMRDLHPDTPSYREMVALCDDAQARNHLNRHIADYTWFLALQRFGMHDAGCVASFSSAGYPQSAEKCSCPFKRQLQYAEANAHLIQMLVDGAFRIFHDIDIPIRGGGSIRSGIDDIWEPLRQTLVLVRDMANGTIQPSEPEAGPNVIAPAPLRWEAPSTPEESP